MTRLHLFEFEDLEWFPKAIRNYGTDFLEFVANRFDFYKTIVPLLVKGIKKSHTNNVIDLASGGGGGWIRLSKHLQKEVPELNVILTDYYPNIDAFQKTKASNPDVFNYKATSVNALEVPKDIRGLRTQFLSFHHFKPKDAQQILQNAVDNDSPIAIFEAQERNFIHFLKFFFSPINVLLVTPFIKPFKIGRIFFTYIIPIVPLFVWWDGLVSVARTYSVDEMAAMTEKLNNTEKFTWEVGKKKEKGFTILYLLGYPNNSNKVTPS